MRPTQLGFALVCTFLGVGCSASQMSGVDPDRLAFSDGPMLRQIDRPTSCADGTQPAILGVAGAERTPVWGCLAACPLGQEFVSNVVTWDNGEKWELEPGCQLSCDRDEHRTSYFDVAQRGHCSPGAVTDPAQVATLARERALQLRVRVEADRKGEVVAESGVEEAKRQRELRRQSDDAALERVEIDLRTLETTPVPWTFELVQLQYRFAKRLDYLAWQEHTDHQLAIEPAQLHDWTTRVAALAAKRKESEVALGVQRGGRQGLTTTRAMRVKDCQGRCEDDATTCRESCSRLPAGQCDACDQEVRQCKTRCVGDTR